MITIRECGDKAKEIRSIMKNECPNQMILDVHRQLHCSLDNGSPTIFDDLVNGYDTYNVKNAAKYKGRTTVYNIWHTTRIEDITVNGILKNRTEVFNDDWKKKINSNIWDTGNSLNEDQILEFSKHIDFEQLLEYRKEVAKSTRVVIKELTMEDLKTKLKGHDYSILLKNNSVLEENKWLITYWTNSDARRLIYMPILSHHLMHMNQSFNNQIVK